MTTIVLKLRNHFVKTQQTKNNNKYKTIEQKITSLIKVDAVVISS